MTNDITRSSELAIKCSEYFTFLRNYALKKRMANNNEEADDLAQETIAHIIDMEDRGKQVYNGKSKLSTWLIKAMTNVFLMQKRKREEKAEKISLTSEDGEELPLFVDAEQARSLEINHYAQTCLNRLSPLKRKIVSMTDDGMENSEIAKQLSMSVAAVKGQKQHMRRQPHMIELKEYLQSGSKIYRNSPPKVTHE